jgi:hypothetical protein
MLKVNSLPVAPNVRVKRLINQISAKKKSVRDQVLVKLKRMVKSLKRKRRNQKLNKRKFYVILMETLSRDLYLLICCTTTSEDLFFK